MTKTWNGREKNMGTITLILQRAMELGLTVNPDTALVGKVTVDRLNVRDAPSEKAIAVGWLEKDDYVFVFGWKYDELGRKWANIDENQWTAAWLLAI